eukprot:jgi/Mesen1/7874/ME000042S07318
MKPSREIAADVRGAVTPATSRMGDDSFGQLRGPGATDAATEAGLGGLPPVASGLGDGRAERILSGPRRLTDEPASIKLRNHVQFLLLLLLPQEKREVERNQACKSPSSSFSPAPAKGLSTWRWERTSSAAGGRGRDNKEDPWQETSAPTGGGTAWAVQGAALWLRCQRATAAGEKEAAVLTASKDRSLLLWQPLGGNYGGGINSGGPALLWRVDGSAAAGPPLLCYVPISVPCLGVVGGQGGIPRQSLGYIHQQTSMRRMSLSSLK